MNEFKINDFLTLKLEKRKTILYVNGEKYIDEALFCGVLLNIFKKRKELPFPVEIWHNLNYNKEAIDFIIDSGQYKSSEGSFHVSYSEKFWAYCSNLQVWAENDYNTDLLHYQVSFPLLDKLVKVGDQLAKNVFKTEIFRKMKSGSEKAFQFLLIYGYLQRLQSSNITTPFYYSIIYGDRTSEKLSNEEIIKTTLNSDEVEALMKIKKRTGREYVIVSSFYEAKVRKSVFPELFYTAYNGEIGSLMIELTEEHPNIPKELKAFKGLGDLHIYVNDYDSYENIVIPQPPFKISSVNSLRISMSKSVSFPKDIKSIFPNLIDNPIIF